MSVQQLIIDILIGGCLLNGAYCFLKIGMELDHQRQENYREVERIRERLRELEGQADAKAAGYEP
jgi:uncharacterized Fe-S cluster-containing radical SAM superfamily protein